MHDAPLSFLIYLFYTYSKNSQLLNSCELDPCVDEVFDSEKALELNPEVVTLTPGTLCIGYRHLCISACRKVCECTKVLTTEACIYWVMK
jgi:hypothetical protein